MRKDGQSIYLAYAAINPDWFWASPVNRHERSFLIPKR